MASTWTVTLSLVITSCCGTASTCSIMLIAPAEASTKGVRMVMPGLSVRV